MKKTSEGCDKGAYGLRQGGLIEDEIMGREVIKDG